jgi:hypothetical protein
LVHIGVIGCFYRISSVVIAEAESLEKVVSYQIARSFAGYVKTPKSNMHLPA